MFHRIASTQGYGSKMGVKIVVYGLAGMGKTTLCATCPHPIILSAESGLLALARHNLPFIQINTLAELREVFAWLKSSNEARQNFQTICLDSVSEIAEVVLADARSKNKDGRMAYGDMIEAMVKCIKEFRDLPGYHVYMSAKQERIKDETTGVMINQPMMPGNKLGQAVPYLPDEVFKMDIEGTGANSYRLLRTQPDFLNQAKDRSGLLDPIEEPHLGKIINKITLAPQQ
ncbi:AAA family ATPase [Aminobacter phage Erebus]|nr:AAA family ATPase [Aminobacter phage Erebus]